MKTYQKGFVPALGTPTDDEGNFLKDSFCRQVDLMLDAGAVGLLAMGSMGIQATLLTRECRKVAEAALERSAGRVPVYVGAMDCSILRAKERMREMEDLPVAGFVFTCPYYNAVPAEKGVNFFSALCKATSHKVYLYDLPVVTQSKITYPMIKALLQSEKNLGGIKTADINLIRKLMNDPEIPEEFEVFFSGLDMFDVAYSYGVCTNLDGMFTCVPKTAERMYRALAAGDREEGADALTSIIALRDLMLENDLMPSYTAIMNLLGCEGRFHQDYCDPPSEKALSEMKRALFEMGEI